MNRAKTMFLAFVCLIITASLYAAQPILPELAEDFHTSLSQMGNFMTLTLLGNGIAQVMVIPLADKYEKRILAQIFLLLGAFANLFMAISPSIQAAYIGGLLIGFYCCSNMLILSYASNIAAADRKGQATASIMSGVLSGILLSRLISGTITRLFSWRIVYLVIAVCLLAAFGVFFLFPKSKSESNGHIRYSVLLLSIAELIYKDKGLRKRMVSGMSSFFVFNFLWTGLTFLLSAKPFSFDGFTIGLFGLAGVSGILASRKAGALSDKGLGKNVIFYAWLSLGISWAILMSAAFISHSTIIGAVIILVIGIVILDAAMQSQHITNQTFILASHQNDKSRALTAYMASNLLMGSAANLFLSAFYSHLQWYGICLISIGVCAANLFIQLRTVS